MTSNSPDAATELHVRRLLTQFAVWLSPTWDPHNADDCALDGDTRRVASQPIPSICSQT